ncbi:ArsR/SmtB family transcription factor [Sporolactobacillus vineae]|uniref:ArsR/SmtB family transcription factor n=1 Tax=Sporolactobacillus vineae TaxID=444463 RepID=UPI00028821A7|nr:helix-turn-helix domain-containing protein [Sporolactobacillus vineae]
MKEFFYITTLDQLKVISDPLRTKILWSLDEREKTGKILSEEMHLSPSKIRYHLTELERVGLIEVVRTEVKNGILQKFYRPVARNISLEKVSSLLNGEDVPDWDSALKENAYCALEELRKNIARAEFRNRDFLFVPYRAELTREEEQEVRKKIKDLYQYMQSRSERKTTEPVKTYYTNLAFFPEK